MQEIAEQYQDALMARRKWKEWSPKMGTSVHILKTRQGIYQVGMGRTDIQGKRNGANIHIFVDTSFIPNCHFT